MSRRWTPQENRQSRRCRVLELGLFAPPSRRRLALEPDRTLYLAVSAEVYHDLFEEPVGQLMLSKGRLRLLVVSTEAEVIEQWTPSPPSAT